MAGNDVEIILDGGGPWGFRLQGGKDFGIPLNVSRVSRPFLCKYNYNVNRFNRYLSILSFKVRR